MNKLITICLLLITGLTQAQDFDFECLDDKFGDISTFFPSVFDAEADEVVYDGTLVSHGSIYVNGNHNPGFSAYFNNEDHPPINYGNTVIYEWSTIDLSINYGAYYTNSFDDEFNDLRVVGGEFKNYVLIRNIWNKGQIFAKWGTTGVIDMLFVLHNYDNADVKFNSALTLSGPINFTKPN